MKQVAPTSIALAALVVIMSVAALPAGAAGPRPVRLGERVRALASNTAGAIAVTRHDVLLVDEDGFVRRRFNLGDAEAPRHERMSPASDDFAMSAGVQSDTDFNDPSDPDSDIEDPENLLIDDDAEPRTRRKSPPDTPVVVAAAAGGKLAWMGRADGLWRIDTTTGAAERVLSSTRNGFDGLAASADGGWVVAERDGWLLRSHDRGATFEAFVPTTGPSRRLGVTARGTVFLIDDEGLRVAREAEANADPIGLVGATDMAVCGDDVLALASGRLFAIAANKPGEIVLRDTGAVPAETDRLACAADGSVIVGFGARLWTSLDRGHTWSPRDDLPAAAIATVAVAGASIWVATSLGLWSLPAVVRTAEVSGTVAETPDLGTRATSSFLPLSADGPSLSPRASWWSSLLPVVDFEFIVARSSRRRDVRAFVLLTFVLDRNRWRALERHRLSSEAAGRRQAAAAATLSLSQPIARSRDPVDAAERAALAHALESSHE